MFTDAQSSLFVTSFLTLLLVGSSVAILYWAGTIENNIENNPDK